MTKAEQDEAFQSYAANLQASMNRHPAGKRMSPQQARESAGYVGTPIYDSIVLGEYEPEPSPFDRLTRVAASTYGLILLALILLWVFA